MTPYGVIGDSHLGFKAYDTDRRTKECSDTFAVAVGLLSHLPVIFIPGDLFDDTTCPNWVKKELIKLKEEHRDQIWVIDGGNHDSTKTYSSVSVLDAFAEVHNVIVVNDFIHHELDVCGLKVLAIPHTRAQQTFLDTIDLLLATDKKWDICLLHCMVNSGLDLGPNDLNIDMWRLEQLANRCKHVWIGHQHEAVKTFSNVYIPGGIMEFNFGELGKKFVYEVNADNIIKLAIPQLRKMTQLEIDWDGPVNLLQTLKNLSEDSVYKILVNGIPTEEYSNAKSAMDVIIAQFPGDIIYSLNRTGHVDIAVTEINASFDLLSEFEEFTTANNISCAKVMRELLEDAISEVLCEEED